MAEIKMARCTTGMLVSSAVIAGVGLLAAVGRMQLCSCQLDFSRRKEKSLRCLCAFCTGARANLGLGGGNNERVQQGGGRLGGLWLRTSAGNSIGAHDPLLNSTYMLSCHAGISLLELCLLA